MMIRILPLAALAAMTLAACEQPRGVGLGPLGGNGPEVPAAEVTTFSLPTARPIPSYTVATGTGPESAVSYGGEMLMRPQANLELDADGETYLLRQVRVGTVDYVVVQGDVAPGPQIPVEIRRRSGCLLTGIPTVVRAAGGGAATVVYQLDCS